ncbi:MAG: LLM class flavin-dependent oxidoreductase [Chloroflexi bacterium]|nr:LLM class flavin-dependent oxidoreductase [Chloroflexota bacterium]
MTRPLSLLDLTYIPSGSDSSATVKQSVATAQLAEELGYERIWYAEHHNTAGLASGAPEIMIAHVGAHTKSIRLGSGGVMLPNQAPLKVTETFHLLEALHPGRIDLGLGRAPGTDQKTALALRRNPDALAAEDYPQNVLELLAYDDRSFPEGHFFEKIVATPSDQKLPPVWLLGSSAFSGNLAAQLGLGFSFAAHINKPLAADVLRAYKAQFQPSERFTKPASMLAVGVIVGETEDHARDLALIHRVGMYRLLKGAMGKSPTIEEAKEIVAGIEPQFQMQLDSMQANQFVGTAADVAPKIKELADLSEADEVMITTMIGFPKDIEYTIRNLKAEWDKIDN